MECWIFDLDGTLANDDRRKHYLLETPMNWDGWYSEVIRDRLNLDIAKFVDYGISRGIKIILCTGRDERCRVDTEQWLRDYKVKYEILYMRKNKDFRQDDIIKKEMLDDMRFRGYNPTMAFEDRDRVVKMWRENGIRCLQVQEGNF